MYCIGISVQYSGLCIAFYQLCWNSSVCVRDQWACKFLMSTIRLNVANTPARRATRCLLLCSPIISAASGRFLTTIVQGVLVKFGHCHCGCCSCLLLQCWLFNWQIFQYIYTCNILKTKDVYTWQLHCSPCDQRIILDLDVGRSVTWSGMY